MQELNTLVNNVMKDMAEQGQIEKIIREKVESSVEEAFSSMFRSYGKLGKQIEKGLEDNLNIDFSQCGLQEFSAVMVDAVKGVAHKHMKEAAQGRFLEDIEKMLSPAPKEITVQELVNLFIEYWREDAFDPSDLDELVTVEIEHDDGSCLNGHTLKLWKCKEESYGRSERSPDLHLYISKDKDIRIIWSGREHLGTTNYGAEAKVFQMYAARTLISDIDTVYVHNLDTELRVYDY
ncbi:hypothetical protein [Pontibacterium sp.]|uniref:hypothetical protein n=1 Tax=Pontibacterium sp. TaxID=2036026 RepID=UPI0035669B0F